MFRGFESHTLRKTFTMRPQAKQPIKKFDWVLIQYRTKDGDDQFRAEGCSVGKAIRDLVKKVAGAQVLVLKTTTSESASFLPPVRVVNRCNDHRGFTNNRVGDPTEWEVQSHGEWLERYQNHIKQTEHDMLNS